MQSRQLYTSLAMGLFMLFLLSACNKDNSTTPNRDDNNNNNNGSGKSINDSIFFISKDIYLWTDALPDSATFRPNSFSSPTDMFNALMSYKKDNANNYLDRYSFLDNGGTSRVLQQGIAGDMGFDVGYQTATTLNVIYVYPGSPADKAGIKRGWKLTAVNGVTSFQYGDGKTDKMLNAAFASASATFGFLKPDNTPQQNTLTAVNYKLNPVLYTHLYNFNGTKIGYFVLNNFNALADVKTAIDTSFDSFAKAGVKQVIIDLRYNGGGLLETAEYLANKLVPAAKSNTEMYSQYYNNNVNTKNFSSYFKTMKALPYYPTMNWSDIFYSEATTYKVAKFQKEGALDLTKVNFLVTRNTVSASELLYNVLKPAMTTTLIGDTTYGKPVGFIAISFGKYDMYAVNFQTKNAAGEGDYFTGLKPQVLADDDYSNDWGSLKDPLLRASLIDMGVPAGSLGRAAKVEGNILARTSANRLDATHFKGMIQTFKK